MTSQTVPPADRTIDTVTEANRIYSSVSGLVESYGATLPEAVVEARRRYVDLTRQRRSAIPTPLPVLARKALDDGTPKGINDAVKELAASRDRDAILGAMTEAAAVAVTTAINASADEIADAVICSRAVRDAVEMIREHAPRVPAGTPKKPSIERNGPDVVIAAAFLAKAEATIVRALKALDASRIVSAGTSSEVSPDEDLARVAVRVYADLSEAKPQAADRAIRGVRPGALDVAVWTQPRGYGAPIPEDGTRYGVRPAIVAATDGVRIEAASSWSDLEERIARVSETATGPLTGAASAEWDAKGPKVRVM